MAPTRSSGTRVEPSSSATGLPAFKRPKVASKRPKPQRSHESEDYDEDPMVVDGEEGAEEADRVDPLQANTSQQAISEGAAENADEATDDVEDDEVTVVKKQAENASLSDLRSKINFYLMELERNSTKFTGMNNKHRLQELLNKYYELSQKVSRTREMVLEGKLLDSILNVCVQCLAGVSQTWTLDDFIQRAGKKLYGDDYDGTEVGIERMRPKAFQRMHQTLNACAVRDPNLEGVHCLFGRMNLLQAPPPPKERRKAVREEFQKVEKQPTRMQGQTAEAKEEEAIVKRVEKLREHIVKTYREMKRQPLSLWHLIIDIDSFENSVQSLFLFLYLCKEGFVVINFADDPAWPTLVPISDDAGIDATKINERLTQQRAEDFHWMPTFTMPKWQSYCEAIKSGMAENTGRG